MKKRRISAMVLSAALSFGMLGGALPTAAAAETATAKVWDFTTLHAGDALPAGLSVTQGTAVAGEGYLELAKATRLLLPEEMTAKDFTYEVEFTIHQADSPTRWVGFMYRYQSPDRYLQMGCPKNSVANTADTKQIDSAVWNSGWGNTGLYNYTEQIDSAKKYTAKITAKGDTLSLSLNGTLLGTPQAGISDGGRFGVQTADPYNPNNPGCTARIYRISVQSDDAVPSDEETPVTAVASIKTLYEPETGILQAPTVIQPIDSDSAYAALKTTSGERTQVAKFTLADKDLNVKVGDKTYSIAAALEKCGEAILPMFVTSDKETAEAFAQYVTDHQLFDLLLASDKADALKAAQAKNKSDIRYAYLAGAVSGSNTMTAISRAAHEAGAAITIITPNQYMTREVAEYLQIRALAVWLDIEEVSDEQLVHTAVDCGANGVTVKDFSSAYRLYEKVTAETSIRKTFIIGHRGMPGNISNGSKGTIAPENSKESYLEAVKAGADGIECDVHMTRDGVLVSNHNGSVDGYTTTNATGSIGSKTWDELSKLTLKPAGDYTTSTFCKMEWYFQILKDNPKMVGFIELKNTSETVVKKTVEMMEAMGVQDQVVFISFFTNGHFKKDQFEGLEFVRKYAPYAATSQLSYDTYIHEDTSTNPSKKTPVEGTDTAMGKLALVMKRIGATSSVPDYNMPDFSGDLIRAGRHRGIIFQSWTVDSLSDMQNQSKMGVTAVTTNWANRRSGDSVLNAYQKITAAGMFGKVDIQWPDRGATEPVDDTKKPDTDTKEPETNVPTGVSVSHIPYVLLAVSLICLAAISASGIIRAMKRRRQSAQ